jgi:hypothetical protein
MVGIEMASPVSSAVTIIHDRARDNPIARPSGGRRTWGLRPAFVSIKVTQHPTAEWAAQQTRMLRVGEQAHEYREKQGWSC